MTLTGHTMKKMRTILTAQQYNPDWPVLELHFPEILGMKDYAEKWAYIEERCRESEEDARFVEAHRPKVGSAVVKDRVVTDAFCALIVATLIDNSTGIKDFKYHDSGIGTQAENANETALQTPWGGARTVGTQEEGTNTKAYKSIATTTYTSTKAIIEHGLFSAASGVTLMDRTKLGAALNVVNGNQIEWTFEIALTSGS